jgi:signal transduction histidine kinase
VPCFVTILDRDLRLVRANQRMRATFGPAVGEPCYRVYKRRELPCDSCPALEALRDGHEHTAEQRGLSAAGEETNYVVTAAPLWSEGGEGDRRVDFVVEMSTDVTRFKALEREKLEAERLGAVGQTVAGLAHGIKNILMGLEGGVYVMNSGLRQGQTEKIQRGTEMLARNVSKISNLVKSLLSFSKGHVPKVAETDLNAVAREVLALYRDAAGRVGVGLVGELGEGIAPAPMEAEGIHACLTNLVSNAIDACQMSERPGRTVRINTREEGGALVIEVADDGLGMDCEIKKKIFTTFFTTKGGGGTGLGLLLTRKIVQEHGGKILVESEPGAGTSFRIVLPRERLPQVTAEAEGASGP